MAKKRSTLCDRRLSLSLTCRRSFLSWLLAIVVLCGVGCRPSREVSDRASPLPLLERDPAENGIDADRWPQWRGLNGAGIAPAGSPPIRFSDTQGYRWKTSVPGRGNSSPVVWDDVVLLTTEFTKADPPTLAVLCFDRDDGRLLWQADAGTARGRTHVKNGHASASTATDGRHVFTCFGGTGLFCHDLAGNQQWHVDFGSADHLWGLASSPVLFRDTVIQLCDHEGRSFIAAFDQRTGEERWRTPRSSQGSWSTPVFVEADDGSGQPRTEMIVQGGSGLQRVIAYDPNTGKELWRAGETTDLVTPLPLVCDGLVCCASGRNGPIFAIEPGGKRATADRVVWKLDRGGPYIPSGVCYRNRLYLIGDGGPLCCYNPGDGQLIWRTRLSGPFTASLIAADGRIYAVNERGTVFVFAAGDSFELLATNKLGSRCLATPAVARGDLFLRTKTELYCFVGNEKRPADASAPRENESKGTKARRNGRPADPRTHGSRSWPLFRGDAQATGVAHERLPETLDLLWTFSIEKGGFESTAAIADGTVFVGSTDGNLYALDLADGRKRWEFSTPLGFSASASVRRDKVYIGDCDGKFYCIDAASGKKLWDFTAEAEIDSSANFHGDHVLFGSQDSFLYCLGADSGKLVWKYQSPDQIRCFPAVLENLGFVAGCDGNLHIVDLQRGEEIGKVDIDAPTGSTPAVLDGTVFVGTEGQEFLAIDPKREKILWRYQAPKHGAAFRSSAAATPEAIIVGSRDKRLHALDPKNGRELWSFTAKGRIDSSPVVVGGRVFVGSADGRLYGLNAKTGKKLWHFEVGGAVIASPAVADGRLVIGNDSGSLYCFGLKKVGK